MFAELAPSATPVPDQSNRKSLSGADRALDGNFSRLERTRGNPDTCVESRRVLELLLTAAPLSSNRSWSLVADRCP